MSRLARSARHSPNATMIVLGLAGFVYAVLQAAVLPALPTLQHHLHISVDAASWILITYLLSASVATPIIGRLGDMYGKDRLFIWTMLGLALGTLLAALANSIAVLDIARVIQGIGGGVVPLAFGIVRDEMPPRRLATAIGIQSSMLGVGIGFGIVLGALILEHFSWHWLFWLPLIPTLLITVVAYFYIPPSPVRTPSRINWIAALLMSVGLSAVLIAVSEAANWGWGSVRTLGVIVAGLAVCAAWIAWEVRSAVPLVDMRLMRMRTVWTTNLAATLVGGGMYAVVLIVPEFVQEPRSSGYGLGDSVLQSGLILLPLAVMMLLMSLQAGRISRRFGSKASLVVGALTTGLSFVLLLVAHTASWQFYAATTVFGIGIGLSYAALGTLIVAAVPRTHTGVASGMNAVMRTLGGAIGAAFVATFIAASTSANGQPTESGFLVSMGVSAGLLGLAALAGTLIPRSVAAVEQGVAAATERPVSVSAEAA